MRLFAAIAPPADLSRYLIGSAGKLAGWRLTPVERLHITLAFIGEIDSVRAGIMAERLAGISFEPFEVIFDGVGFFPKVFWLGVRPSAELSRLKFKVDEALRLCGVPGGDGGDVFTPHVTLARRGRRLAGREADALLAASMTAAKGRSFCCREFQLYSSRLDSGGPVYRVEHRFSAMPQ